jgi:hypothetical protein
MVRRGSTVRVRQRACEKACKCGPFLSWFVRRGRRAVHRGGAQRRSRGGGEAQDRGARARGRRADLETDTQGLGWKPIPAAVGEVERRRNRCGEGPSERTHCDPEILFGNERACEARTIVTVVCRGVSECRTTRNSRCRRHRERHCDPMIHPSSSPQKRLNRPALAACVSTFSFDREIMGSGEVQSADGHMHRRGTVYVRAPTSSQRTGLLEPQRHREVR